MYVNANGAVTYHTLLFCGWIKEWYPCFVPSDDQLPELPPAAGLVDAFKIDPRGVCTCVFHGWREEAKNPAGTELNEL